MARSLFFLAPCTSLGTGVIAFVLANHYDFPSGQTAAPCLCALLAGAWAAARGALAIAAPRMTPPQNPTCHGISPLPKAERDQDLNRCAEWV